MASTKEYKDFILDQLNIIYFEDGKMHKKGEILIIK